MILSVKQKVTKPSVVEDEAYMKRVYGKAAFQAKRSTQKEPYLRYQSTPKAQLPQPATKPVTVKG